MFDYIRCIDINDQGVTSPFAPTGQVVPIQTSSTTMGFGRFALPYEIGIDFVCEGMGTNTPKTTSTTAQAVDPLQAKTTTPNYAGGGGGTTPASGKMAIQAILLMSFMNPGEGTPSYTPSFTVQITGMNSFQIGTATAAATGFPASGATYVNYGSTPGTLVEPTAFVANKLLGTANSTQFPFYSNIIEVPYTSSSSKLAFVGGQITIKIYAGNNTDSAHLIQTITNLDMTKLNGSFPLPSLPDPGFLQMGTGTPYTNTTTNADRFMSFSGNYSFFGWDFSVSGNNSEGAQDTVQSMVLTSGDVRMAFRQTGVPGLYSADDVSGSPRVNASFIQSTGANAMYQGCSKGFLVNGVNRTTAPNFAQYVPHTILASGGAYLNGGISTTEPLGDWDTGSRNTQDGPFINKVDEGDLTVDTTKGYIPYFPGWSATLRSSIVISPPIAKCPLPECLVLYLPASGTLLPTRGAALLFRPEYHPPVEHSCSSWCGCNFWKLCERKFFRNPNHRRPRSLRLSPRSPLHGPVLDAGHRAVSDQRTAFDRGESQHELSDHALRFYQSRDGYPRGPQMGTAHGDPIQPRETDVGNRILHYRT